MNMRQELAKNLIYNVLRRSNPEFITHVVAAQRIFKICPSGEKVVARTPHCPVAVAGGRSHIYGQLGNCLGAVSIPLNRQCHVI